ncbi:leucine-rich repeat domain-containing protein [Butyrivibrio sp. WCD2001]|uniref:leucine-rich repeat domain-containing protein n=1 Tax=Butyrivibrio sp. WCD2001 TaxID=1280681 RepID=UPI0004789CD1|nr:leucine-rich repeat domain-containing protein [Butyrivibrio sp. WCD2001]
MKKLLMCMVFCAMVLLMPGSSFDVGASDISVVKSGECGENCMYTLRMSSRTSSSIGYSLEITGSGDMMHYTPGRATSMPAPWCSYNQYIEEVTISEGITSLYGLSSLGKVKGIVIPGTVRYLGESCFDWSKFETVTFKTTGEITIYRECFQHCTNLREIELPHISGIDTAVFRGCSGLQKVTFLYPDDVKAIGQQAFSLCTSLKEIEIPRTVRRMGQDAFAYSGLEHVTIPGSLEEIPFNCFKGCEDLVDARIGKGVKVIGNDAFYQCNALEYMVIPSTVTDFYQIAVFESERPKYFRLSIIYSGKKSLWDQIRFTDYSYSSSYDLLRYAYLKCTDFDGMADGNPPVDEPRTSSQLDFLSSLEVLEVATPADDFSFLTAGQKEGINNYIKYIVVLMQTDEKTLNEVITEKAMSRFGLPSSDNLHNKRYIYTFYAYPETRDYGMVKLKFTIEGQAFLKGDSAVGASGIVRVWLSDSEKPMPGYGYMEYPSGGYSYSDLGAAKAAVEDGMGEIKRIAAGTVPDAVTDDARRAVRGVQENILEKLRIKADVEDVQEWAVKIYNASKKVPDVLALFDYPHEMTGVRPSEEVYITDVDVKLKKTVDETCADIKERSQDEEPSAEMGGAVAKKPETSDTSEGETLTDKESAAGSERREQGVTERGVEPTEDVSVSYKDDVVKGDDEELSSAGDDVPVEVALQEMRDSDRASTAVTVSQDKKTLKFKKLKKKKQKVTISVENTEGKIAVKNESPKKIKKYITAKIKGRSVVCTLKKGAPKGTYKIKVSVSQEGAAGVEAKTFKIVVR